MQRKEIFEQKIFSKTKTLADFVEPCFLPNNYHEKRQNTKISSFGFDMIYMHSACSTRLVSKTFYVRKV